jgi:SWIM zinc finger
MYEEARQLPWLYCLDNILNNMCTRIATLREANKNETGVVPKCAQTMETRWKNCAPFGIIQLEQGGHRYKVTRSTTNIFQTNHVVDIQKKECSCGLWQEFGIPCVDAMAYYRLEEKKTLNEIMASVAVSDYHKYPFYHELMRRNINPVIMDTLITSKEDSCLPPDAVLKQPGRPKTK